MGGEEGNRGTPPEQAGEGPRGTRGGRISRRQLLRHAMWGSLGVFVIEGGLASLGSLWPLRAAGFGGMVAAGKVDDFPVNSVTKVAQGKFYLVRLPEGFLALYWKCPHLGCTVPWSPPEDPGRFHCPCHGSIYEITGQKVAGPAPRSMDLMAIEIKDGTVLVDTGRITRRLNYHPSQVTRI